jgi:hypothetical protein
MCVKKMDLKNFNYVDMTVTCAVEALAGSTPVLERTPGCVASVLMVEVCCA